MSRFFLDNVWYFITVPTHNHEPLFQDLTRRDILLGRLKDGFQRFHLPDHHYSVMSDHYHLLTSVTDGSVVPKFLRYVNGGTSFHLHLERTASVWGEYFVFVPTTDELLARVTGYVVGNPIKHGEVTSFQELVSWRFSSFAQLISEVGKEAAQEMVQSVIAVEEPEFFHSLVNGTKVPMKTSQLHSHFSGVGSDGTEVPMKTSQLHSHFSGVGSDGTEVPMKFEMGLKSL
jgi:REP element-mobilizing transposase RayT